MEKINVYNRKTNLYGSWCECFFVLCFCYCFLCRCRCRDFVIGRAPHWTLLWPSTVWQRQQQIAAVVASLRGLEAMAVHVSFLSDKTIFIFCVCVCVLFVSFGLYCCLHARIQIDKNMCLCAVVPTHGRHAIDDKNTFEHKVNASGNGVSLYECAAGSHMVALRPPLNARSWEKSTFSDVHAFVYEASEGESTERRRWGTTRPSFEGAVLQHEEHTKKIK